MSRLLSSSARCGRKIQSCLRRNRRDWTRSFPLQGNQVRMERLEIACPEAQNDDQVLVVEVCEVWDTHTQGSHSSIVVTLG